MWSHSSHKRFPRCKNSPLIESSHGLEFYMLFIWCNLVINAWLQIETFWWFWRSVHKWYKYHFCIISQNRWHLMNESVFVCSLSPHVQTPKNQWQCLSSTVRWHRNTWRCRQRSHFSNRGSKSEEYESIQIISMYNTNWGYHR